jgi:hypothetical protein
VWLGRGQTVEGYAPLLRDCSACRVMAMVLVVAVAVALAVALAMAVAVAVQTGGEDQFGSGAKVRLPAGGRARPIPIGGHNFQQDNCVSRRRKSRILQNTPTSRRILPRWEPEARHTWAPTVESVFGLVFVVVVGVVVVVVDR